MIALIALIAHVGIFTAFGESWTIERAAVFTLSSVVVGGVASQVDYSTWFHKSCWLLAFLGVFIALPSAISAASYSTELLPASVAQLWLLVTVIVPPVGFLAGAFRWYVEREA